MWAPHKAAPYGRQYKCDSATTLDLSTVIYGGRRRGQSQTHDHRRPRHITADFAATDLLALMDDAGVERAVLLQGPYYGERDAQVAAAARRYPDRFIGAFAPDPRSSHHRLQFRRCVDDYGLRILKFEMSAATGLCGIYPDLRIDSDAMRWLLEAARQHDLVVVFDLGAVDSVSYQTDRMQRIAGRFPELSFVIAHLAQPPLATPDDAPRKAAWQRQIALGRLPNVHFDLSALPAYAPDAVYPFVAAQDYIRQALKLVGAGKIMWGHGRAPVCCAKRHSCGVKRSTVKSAFGDLARSRPLPSPARPAYAPAAGRDAAAVRRCVRANR